MDSTPTTVILVSFEGPDRYSLVGGLGVRVTELSRALADAGHQTHVLFVGDPFRPAVELTAGGRLVLHRWGQWLSKYYPRGVYDGEEAKLYDFNESAPRFIVDDLVRPALAALRASRGNPGFRFLAEVQRSLEALAVLATTDPTFRDVRAWDGEGSGTRGWPTAWGLSLG